jgi:hypothetical protein
MKKVMTRALLVAILVAQFVKAPDSGYMSSLNPVQARPAQANLYHEPAKAPSRDDLATVLEVAHVKNYGYYAYDSAAYYDDKRAILLAALRK